MSVRAVPPAAKLLFSVIYRDEDRFLGLLPLLGGRFGAIETRSDRFPFDFTRYYAAEMGDPLWRRFVVIRDPVPREALPEIKIGAEVLENALGAGGRRTVNIDPGLLTEENFILATGKNYSHRVYLRDGVYGDLALVYREGAYRPLPWTYPDYASDGIRSYLGEVRGSLRSAMGKTGGASACG